MDTRPKDDLCDSNQFVLRCPNKECGASVMEVPMDPKIISPWSADWLWSLPLIVATVVIHSFGLGMIYHLVSAVLDRTGKNRLSHTVSGLIVGGTALFATLLHGFEGSMWAAAYLLLGALPGRRSAMLYSLGAMTTYGKADINLDSRWQLMGPLEALDGWILFGLTTAVLIAIIQNVWQASKRST